MLIICLRSFSASWISNIFISPHRTTDREGLDRAEVLVVSSSTAAARNKFVESCVCPSRWSCSFLYSCCNVNARSRCLASSSSMEYIYSRFLFFISSGLLQLPFPPSLPSIRNSPACIESIKSISSDRDQQLLPPLLPPYRLGLVCTALNKLSSRSASNTPVHLSEKLSTTVSLASDIGCFYHGWSRARMVRFTSGLRPCRHWECVYGMV